MNQIEKLREDLTKHYWKSPTLETAIDPSRNG
jgi:hypothetical protein